MKLILLSVLTCLSVFSTALATDFDCYNPDKTGQTNCSALLAKALADTKDGCLDIAAGKYLLESPVTLKGVTIQALHGRATFAGANKDTDLFLVPKVFGIKLVNLGFTNGKRAFGNTGITTVRENQFNSCGGAARIVVEDGCGLVAEHNYFAINTKTNQVAIKAPGSKARVFERENHLENLGGMIIER